MLCCNSVSNILLLRNLNLALLVLLQLVHVTLRFKTQFREHFPFLGFLLQSFHVLRFLGRTAARHDELLALFPFGIATSLKFLQLRAQFLTELHLVELGCLFLLRHDLLLQFDLFVEVSFLEFAQFTHLHNLGLMASKRFTHGQLVLVSRGPTLTIVNFAICNGKLLASRRQHLRAVLNE